MKEKMVPPAYFVHVLFCDYLVLYIYDNMSPCFQLSVGKARPRLKA
jgi:hypothetical protein